MSIQKPAVVSETLSDRLVTPEVVEEVLAVKLSTLATWRSEGYGPKYVKLSAGRSGAVRYPLSEVMKFAADPQGYRPRPVAQFHKPETLRRGGQPRLPVAKARRRRGKGEKAI